MYVKMLQNLNFRKHLPLLCVAANNNIDQITSETMEKKKKLDFGLTECGAVQWAPAHARAFTFSSWITQFCKPKLLQNYRQFSINSL